jgi:alanine dehydrogenase
VAWGIQSGGVSSSVGFNISLYLESRAAPGISASDNIYVDVGCDLVGSDAVWTCRKIPKFQKLYCPLE